MLIQYTTGEVRGLRVRLLTSTGAQPDPTGATVELRIAAPGGPVVLSAVPDESGWRFALTPETLPLPPGRYAAELWGLWPGGERRAYAVGVVQVLKGIAA